MADGLGFIDPTAGGGRALILPAPRPSDLSGKVVGLIDNTKEQADVILKTIGEALCERFGVESVIMRRKEHYSKPAPEAMIDEMAQQVDIAIAGLGGWGSCTLCSVHDTVGFEKRGIPSTTIITTAFKKAAEFQFRSKGMEGHPYVQLPHPVSNLQPDEMRELTLQFVDEVVDHLRG